MVPIKLVPIKRAAFTDLRGRIVVKPETDPLPSNVVDGLQSPNS